MNQFSIRDIENLCGIKAHTLRIWEQRYKLFTPKRKLSQHRVYDCDDLKELLRISFLYHNGYKISKIAELSPEQVQAEIARIKPLCCNYEIYVHQLIEACLSFDKDSFEKIINSLAIRIGLEKCILHVFYPFLQRIGLLWMTNHVIPAQEHFSSHIIRKKIICGIDGLETEEKAQPHNILIFAPTGELHEIPLLCVNYFFRRQGIRTTYFGANVSTEAIQYYMQYHEVSHIYLHVITHFDNCSPAKIIDGLCRDYPKKTIVISGPALSCVPGTHHNLLHFHSLEEVISLSKELALQKSS
jgi:DNA-binding transcriptional MerR regulator